MYKSDLIEDIATLLCNDGRCTRKDLDIDVDCKDFDGNCEQCILETLKENL